MATALFTHPACLRHDVGSWHPECPDRLRAVWRALEAERFSSLLREEAPVATREMLLLVHPAAHVDAIFAAAPAPGALFTLDADTIMSDGSLEAALRAAGGAVAAVDAVMEGWARTAFVATRPPGHHAEPDLAMGFCLFGNAAIAALHARARWGLRRVAVLDFDVHHGNGTAAVAADDADFFYGSSHQMPCFPGTGDAHDHGRHGNIRNVALPPGSGSEAFRAGWDGTILPALDAFAPELIIVSTGFDAHRDDPLAEIKLDVADFAWVTKRLTDAASRHGGGKIVSVLEGGYDLDALAAGVTAHVAGLMAG